ncbi:MAG: hypothetical protein NUW24_07490 [Anaerolineae bacterium]|jgi:hypothetical protein|nr:hypothetical protein [Anaerolineae bacterium]
MVSARINVVLDYDGTLTAEEKQAATLAAKSLATLSLEILRVPLVRLEEEYWATRQALVAAPHRYWWEVNGLIASYCDEGAFILNTTTLQIMLKGNPHYSQAVAQAFPDARYDPVVDCTNFLFHYHTAELEPRFRPATRSMLARLIARPDFVPVVLTNSLGDKVQRNLATLHLGELMILGDTRQYEMDPTWEHWFSYPGLGRIQVLPVDENHQVDLRRPAYYRALERETLTADGLVVVADTLSLPGALPLVMGIPFVLLRTPYTPTWCFDFVANHPMGHVLDDLADLPDLLVAIR